MKDELVLENPVISKDAQIETADIKAEKKKAAAEARKKAKLEKARREELKKRPRIDKAQVKHIFTDGELLDISRQLSRNLQAKADLENQKKAVTSDYTSRIAVEITNINQENTKLSNGYEMRERDVMIFFKPEEKQRYLFDRETGGFIRTESMQPSDFQIELLPQLDPSMNAEKDLPKKKMAEIKAILDGKKKPSDPK